MVCFFLKNKKAFSILEIIIASIILALIISGLANLFVSVKRLNLNSQLKMCGGEVEKYQLSRFSDAVRQDQWDDLAGDYLPGNMLRKAEGAVEEPFILSVNPYPTRQYSRGYTVGVPPTFPANSPLRKVTYILTWTEE